MNVRLATDDDADAVEALLDQVHNSGFSHDDFQTAFSLIVDADDKAIMVIDEANRVVGCAVINLVQHLPTLDARLDEVVVDSGSRGKGYGSILVTACEDWAISKGAQKMEFTSRPSRLAANALYQKLGYTIRETNVYQKNLGS